VDGLDLKLAIVTELVMQRSSWTRSEAVKPSTTLLKSWVALVVVLQAVDSLHHPNEMAEVRKLRAAAIYQADKNLPLRKSHETQP